MKQDLTHGHGVGFSLFGGQGVAKGDAQAILNYNTALKNGVPPASAWATTMSKASIAAQEQTRQCIKSKGSLTDLANGLQMTSVKANAAAIGLKALSVAGNMILITAISKGVEWILTYNQRLEEARQEMIELGNEAVETNNKLSDLVDQYKNLGEDGTIDTSELSLAESIQEQIVSLIGSQAEGIDLVNGKYEDQIDLLEKIEKKTRGNNYNDIKRAKVAAEQELTNSIFDEVREYEFLDGHSEFVIQGGAFNSDSDSTALEDFLSKNGFEDRIVKGAQTSFGRVAFKIDTSSTEAMVESYHDAVAVANILARDYWDMVDDESDALYDFYNDLNDFINHNKEKVSAYEIAARNLFKEDAENEISSYLKSNDITSQEDYDKYVTSIEGRTDISEGYREVLLSMIEEIFPDYAKKESEITETTVKDVDKMTVSLENLKSAEESFADLRKFVEEFNEEGQVTFDTLSKLAEATGLSGDEIYEFYQEMLSAQGSAESLNSILLQLIDAIIRLKFISSDGIFTGTIDELTGLFGGMGIINAEEMASAYYNMYKTGEDKTMENAHIRKGYADQYGIDIEKVWTETEVEGEVKRKIDRIDYIYNGTTYSSFDDAMKAAIGDSMVMTSQLDAELEDIDFEIEIAKDSGKSDKALEATAKKAKTLMDILKKLGSSGFNNNSAIVKKYTKELIKCQDELKELANESKDMKDWDLDKLGSELDDIQSSYDAVREAIQEYNESGDISLDTFQKLMEIEPQYMLMLMDENGALQLNSESLRAYSEAMVDQLALKQMMAMMDYVQALSDEEAQLLLTGQAAETAAGGIMVMAAAEVARRVAAGDLSPEEGQALINMFSGIMSWANSAKKSIGGLGKSSKDAADKQAELEEKMAELWKEERLAQLKDAIEARKDLLDRYAKEIDTYDFGIDFADDSEVSLKTDLMSSKLETLTQHGIEMREEFERVASIIPETGDQAQVLADRLTELGQEMRDNIKAIRETQVALMNIRVEAITKAASGHISQLERTLTSLERRLDILKHDDKNDYKYTNQMLKLDTLLPSFTDFDDVVAEKEKEDAKIIEAEQEKQDTINEIVTTALRMQAEEAAIAREKERQELMKSMEEAASSVSTSLGNISSTIESSLGDIQEIYEKELETALQKTEQGTGDIENEINGMQLEAPPIDITQLINSIGEALQEIANLASTETRIPVTIDVSYDVAPSEGSGDLFGEPNGYIGGSTGKGGGGNGLEQFASYRITSDYTNRINPITGKPEHHNGIDYATPSGTPLYAMNDGVVYRVFDDYGGGLTIAIKDANGNIYGFRHLSSVTVKEGDRVVAGQEVSYSGNSGEWTTGAHTEVFVKNASGDYIDPKTYDRYSEGTDNHPGGIALVGEDDEEIAIFPDGTAAILGQNGPQFVDLPKGTEVIPSDETEKILDNSAKISPNGTKGSDDWFKSNILIENPEFANNSSYADFYRRYDALIADGASVDPLFEEFGEELASNLINNRYITKSEDKWAKVSSEELKTFTYSDVAEILRKLHLPASFFAEPQFKKVMPSIIEAIESNGGYATEAIFLQELKEVLDGRVWHGYGNSIAYEMESWFKDRFANRPEGTTGSSGSRKSNNLAFGEDGLIDVTKTLQNINAILDDLYHGTNGMDGLFMAYNNFQLEQAEIQKKARDKGYDSIWQANELIEAAEEMRDSAGDALLETWNTIYNDMQDYLLAVEENPSLFNQEIIDGYVDALNQVSEATQNLEDSVVNAKEALTELLEMGHEKYLTAYEDLRYYLEDAVSSGDFEKAKMYAEGIYNLLTGGSEGSMYKFGSELADRILADPENMKGEKFLYETTLGKVDYMQLMTDAAKEGNYALASALETERNKKLDVMGVDVLKTDMFADKLTDSNDYMALMTEAAEAGNLALAGYYEKLRNEKIDRLQLDTPKTDKYQEALANLDTDKDYMALMMEASEKGDYVLAAAYEQMRNLKLDITGVEGVKTKMYEKYAEVADLSGLDGEGLLEWIDRQLENVNLSEDQRRLFEEWRREVKDSIKETEEIINTAISDNFSEYERHIARQTAELQKEAEAYDILINKAQAKANAEANMYNALRGVRQIQQDITKELATNMNLGEYLDEDTRKLLFNEEDYNVLSRKLKGISADIASIGAWYENQINNLTEDNWYLEAAITAEYERRLDAKQKEYEIARAELDLAKKEQELNNVLNEKNIRMLVRNENGKYEWKYVHNVRQASKIAGEVEALKATVDEARTQAFEDSIVAQKQAEADSLTAEKAAIEKRIELINEETEAMAQAIEDITDPLKDFGLVIKELNSLMNWELIKGAENVNQLYYGADNKASNRGSIGRGSGSKRSYATTSNELLAHKAEDTANAEAELNRYLESNGGVMDATAKKLAEDVEDTRDKYDRAVDSLIGDSPTNGARPVFDQGGSALGKGIMFKDTEYEEYVLNPDQTDYFKRFIENTKGLDIVAQQMAGFIKTPNFPFKENIKSDSYSFSGDIILPGVRNPEDFMVALKNHLQQNSFRNT